MKERKDIDKTQFTDADITDYMGGSETIVEYSEIDKTRPFSESGRGYGLPLAEEDIPTEPDEDDVTIADISLIAQATGTKAQKTLPVVGWLVCVKGPCAGKDYRLHANYNRIGRSTSLDVNVDDPKFSKKPVAWVGYFRETNEYYVGAESSTNVLYVNGMPLPAGQSRMFHAWDRIRMGDTELLFMPLCGEQFTWEPNASKGEP